MVPAMNMSTSPVMMIATIQPVLSMYLAYPNASV